MATAAHEHLSPKGAISAAFALFEDFFGDTASRRVLLEGVDYLKDEDEWKITIGFDVGRVKEVSGTLIGFGRVEKEPIKEKRAFYLAGKTGDFIRMQDE